MPHGSFRNPEDGQPLCVKLDIMCQRIVLEGQSEVRPENGDVLVGSRRAMRKQPTVESVVFVIDDDASARASLKSLFKSVGLYVELFGTPLTNFLRASALMPLPA